DRRVQLAALIGTLFAAVSLPMSGSRGSFLISVALCTMVVWRAGLIFTRVGRRVMLVAAASVCLSMFAYPDALQGVMDRFEGADTDDRLAEALTILPPLSLAKYYGGYTAFGIGTGMT